MHNDGIHSFHVLKEEVLKKSEQINDHIPKFFPLEIRKHQELQAQSKLAITTIRMFMFVNPCPFACTFSISLEEFGAQVPSSS